VLGLLGGRAFRVWIPRFLCRICRATTSILPSWLHPWRWYSIVSIVEALCLWATERATVSQLRARYAASPEGDGWRSLSRWARDFLVRPTLLGWLGFPTSGTTTLGDRLHRFLFHVKPAGRADIREWTTEQVRWAATEALAGSEHRRVSSLTRPVTSAPGVRDALPGVDLATTFPQRKSLLAS